MPWKRPADVPLGQVWLRFQGKGKDGKPGQKFQVRDLDEAHKEECLQLMLETFLRDEPLSRALAVQSDPESVSTILSNWKGFIEQRVSLACFTEVDDQPQDLVGFNFIIVCQRDDEEEDFENIKGESWRKLLKTLLEAESLVNVYDRYGVDAYMSTSGLTVKHEYRGQNIGARIMEARKPLCKAVGLTVISTVYTARSSQVLGAKCGYELLATLPYKHMLKYGIDLSNCESQFAEVRGIKFDF